MRSTLSPPAAKNVWPGLVEGILCYTTFKSSGIVLRLLVEGGRVKLPNHYHRHQVLPGPASRWTLRGNSYWAIENSDIGAFHNLIWIWIGTSRVFTIFNLESLDNKSGWSGLHQSAVLLKTNKDWNIFVIVTIYNLVKLRPGMATDVWSRGDSLKTPTRWSDVFLDISQSSQLSSTMY